MKNDTKMFIVACVGMFIFGIVLISIGSILPALTAKYNLDEIAAGSLISVLPLGILIGSVVFGPVVDRYGYKYLLIISAALITAGMEGFAFTGAFTSLQLSLFLIGFGGGMINGGTNALVADISSENKGARLSLLGVFFGIGALGMPAVLSILSKQYTYDQILAAIGIVVFLIIFYFIAVRFPLPKNPQGFPLAKGIGLLKETSLLMLGLLLLFQSAVEGIMNNWSTTFLQREIGLTPENALLYLSYFVGIFTIVRLFLGILLKKYSPRRVLEVSLLFALVGAISILLSSSATGVLLSMLLIGIGLAAGFPVILGFVGDLYPAMSGTAFSIVLVMALLGNMGVNYFLGIMIHSYGMDQYAVFLTIGLIVMIGVLVVAERKVGGKIQR
jgi:FHS family glucose/mannose:H+ symporter-like MFS transporter